MRILPCFGPPASFLSSFCLLSYFQRAGFKNPSKKIRVFQTFCQILYRKAFVREIYNIAQTLSGLPEFSLCKFSVCC
ncbi:MAG: hypothetical protein COV69_04580 [Parcubacteria group bacterium CG11_big_fil_rev_8_21_14_0_20_39_14]|nr:MAG: hypothetical protein COV69_04580 [Parcubacteria group bacterium CG11_big_fil_rev_8_21_14_0_20_39_14]